MKLTIYFIVYISVIIGYFARWRIIDALRKVNILKDPTVSKQKALEIGRLEYEKRGFES